MAVGVIYVQQESFLAKSRRDCRKISHCKPLIYIFDIIYKFIKMAELFYSFLFNTRIACIVLYHIYKEKMGKNMHFFLVLSRFSKWETCRHRS